MYNNYLKNVETLIPGTTAVENEMNGFLGTDITFNGKVFNCWVDGYKVTMMFKNRFNKYHTIKNIPKNSFTIGKKEATNAKHAEELKKYFNMILMYAGEYEG